MYDIYEENHLEAGLRAIQHHKSDGIGTNASSADGSFCDEKIYAQCNNGVCVCLCVPVCTMWWWASSSFAFAPAIVVFMHSRICVLIFW